MGLFKKQVYKKIEMPPAISQPEPLQEVKPESVEEQLEEREVDYKEELLDLINNIQQNISETLKRIK